MKLLNSYTYNMDKNSLATKISTLYAFNECNTADITTQYFLKVSLVAKANLASRPW